MVIFCSNLELKDLKPFKMNLQLSSSKSNFNRWSCLPIKHTTLQIYIENIQTAGGKIKELIPMNVIYLLVQFPKNFNIQFNEIQNY